MKQDRVNQLFLILSKKGRVDGEEENTITEDDDKDKDLLKELNELYPESDPERAIFQRFLKEHQIQRLGSGPFVNTVNIKITPNDGSAPLVLRVDLGSEYIKEIEEKLRSRSLKDVIAPIHVVRNSTVTNEEKTKTGYLILTDYYEGGDLERYIRDLPNDISDEDRIDDALKIYSEMADILAKVQDENTCFFDMKNGNFLRDKEGNLHVVDAKSMLYTDSPGGVIQKPGLYNPQKWGDFLWSYETKIPELTNTTILADKAHCLMLAKNIYHFVTNQKTGRYFKLEEDTFSAKVFTSSAKGQALKGLLMDMLHPNPAQRISLFEAHKRMALIANPDLSQDKKDNLQAIVDLKNGLKIVGQLPYTLEVQMQKIELEIISAKTENIPDITKKVEVFINNIKENYEKKGLNREILVVLKDCNEYLEKIKNLVAGKEQIIGLKDDDLNHYIEQKYEKLLHATSDEEIRDLKAYLSATVESLIEDAVTYEARKKCYDSLLNIRVIRDGIHNFAMGPQEFEEIKHQIVTAKGEAFHTLHQNISTQLETLTTERYKYKLKITCHNLLKTLRDSDIEMIGDTWKKFYTRRKERELSDPGSGVEDLERLVIELTGVLKNKGKANAMISVANSTSSAPSFRERLNAVGRKDKPRNLKLANNDQEPRNTN